MPKSASPPQSPPSTYHAPQQATAVGEDRSYKPEILVITRTFFPKEGGIEEYVYNRCLQDPDRVVLLAASYPGDYEFDLQQTFTIHRWPMPAWLRTSGKVGSAFKQLYSMVGALMMGLMLFFKYRYRAIEWAHGFDFPSLLLLGYLLPVRYFVYLHGNDLLCPLRYGVLKSLFARTLQRASGLVCNSRFTASYLHDRLEIDTPTYIIHPTVRVEKFGPLSSDSLTREREAIRSRFGISAKAITILSVGRLIPRKGFDRVIDCLPHLTGEMGIDLHFIICGRGTMEAELREQVKELNLGEHVHFAGYVSDTELAGYYTACDIFTMPTVFNAEASSIEGFGIVYREAGYFGKPVIASRIGGVVDAVKHDETGLLVEPNNPEELTAALLRLCRDPDLRQRLGERGRELACNTVPHRSLYAAEVPSSPEMLFYEARGTDAKD